MKSIPERIDIYSKEITQTNFLGFIGRRIQKTYHYYKYWQYKNFKKGSFTFNKKKYQYFYHPSNLTWNNERTIEVPIFQYILKKAKDKKVLEVGNVMGQYFYHNHDVVDKYEKAVNVVNEDIITFNPKKKYDLIISISTLEHVGFDEKKKDKTKVLKGMTNLLSHLKRGGKFIYSIPIDYNTNMDELLKNHKMPYDEAFYLKRVTKDNRWQQTTREFALNKKYNFPFPCANGLFIGVITKK